MKNYILLYIMLFTSCLSQSKSSLKEINQNLLNNNDVSFNSSYLSPQENEGMKNALTKFRLLGIESCNINPEKKYSRIYIEDGFHYEDGFYDGIIIFDNKDVCEITISPYKLRIDSLSYKKVKYGNFIFYTKKKSIEDFKKNNLNEYYRYQLVIENKIDELKKCLEVDELTPKPIVFTKNYYMLGKQFNSYGAVKINYNDIKDGVKDIPYFKKENQKKFMDCIGNLNIKFE
ncbi:hypothetical protein WH221_18250 [Chryseobacterium culicis]|nr:hypothetical protein [Chryseobacterium culicis]